MSELYTSQEMLKIRGKVIKIGEFTLEGGGATTGDTKSAPVVVMPFKEGTFFIRHSGFSAGTTKTLDVKVETKDPAGNYWHELLAFTQITATEAGGEKKDVAANLGEKLALSWTKGSADCAMALVTVYAVAKIM